MNVLVIEDEINIAKPLCRMLEKNNITAESVQDGLSGYLQGRRSTYDVIVLDIMLPEMDGLTVLKKLREEGVFTPILLLTAKDSTEDKVRGLELGADDYLAKPFHMVELIARIRSVARRSRNDGDFGYKAGNVMLDDVSRILTVDGRKVELLKKEFDILKYFLMRPGHTVDKAVLAEAVWGDHIDQSDDFQFVYAQMKNLRRKLAESGADIEIKSIYGFGYKLVMPD